MDTEEAELQPEYDLSQLQGGVRGKYFARYQADPPRIVRLDADIAKAFADDAAVNAALRAYLSGLPNLPAPTQSG